MLYSDGGGQPASQQREQQQQQQLYRVVADRQLAALAGAPSDGPLASRVEASDLAAVDLLEQAR